MVIPYGQSTVEMAFKRDFFLTIECFVRPSFNLFALACTSTRRGFPVGNQRWPIVLEEVEKKETSKKTNKMSGNEDAVNNKIDDVVHLFSTNTHTHITYSWASQKARHQGGSVAPARQVGGGGVALAPERNHRVSFINVKELCG